MGRELTIEGLRTLIGDETVTENTSMADLKMDSLEFTDFALRIEDTFDITLPEEGFVPAGTAADLMALVNRTIGADQ